jgi:uncharacterized protein YndB with AHSA1/START domain
MATPAEATSVRNEVVVNAPVERAFAVFTEQMDRIKPREHNMLGVDIAETVFEQRVGGRIYDRGTDGSECEWATVLAYEPPDRVVFSWNISPHWQVENNPDKRSEVEVRFIAEDERRTRVQLSRTSAFCWDFEAPPGGLEPPACGLEVRCSIQLSYGGVVDRGACARWRAIEVGAAGFEPAAFRPQTECSTRLSYAPTDGSMAGDARAEVEYPSDVWARAQAPRRAAPKVDVPPCVVMPARPSPRCSCSPPSWRPRPCSPTAAAQRVREPPASAAISPTRCPGGPRFRTCAKRRCA